MTRSTLVRITAGAALLAGGGLAARTAPEPPSGAPGGPLQARAEAILGPGAGWSVMAWSLDRDEVLFAINADRIRVPASNNKVYSAAWALDALGSDYRFPTDLLITGPVENGVLRGDVVIRGSGDPAFGYQDYEGRDRLRPLRNMAQTLVDNGVRVVEGGVVGDPHAFDRQHYLPSWPSDTDGGAAAYAPTVSGLPYQRNLLIVELKPGAGGVVHETEPAVPEIPVINNARPGGGRGYAVRRADDDTVRIRGGIAGRGPHRFGIGVNDPAVLTAGALRQALVEAGIEVRGQVRVDHTPENAALVHRHHSIPLGEMMGQLNRHSDNFFAEHVWKAAVAATVGQGSFAKGPLAAAHYFNARAGIPYGHVWQADGSGLSRLNQSSALALIQLLRYAHGQPWGEAFHESMAIAGDPGGSMRRLFVGTPAQGRINAKTGYIRNVRALSGYADTRGGERVAFSFLYNGGNTGGARDVQTQLGLLLTEFSR